MKKYGIITAMQEEADLIIEKYQLNLVSETQNIAFYENVDMVLVLCGIGKIQASIGTTLLIEKYNPETLINIGIAGNAHDKQIQIGDILLIKTVYQHDMYLPFDGEHLSYAKDKVEALSLDIDYSGDNFSVHKDAICATGDQFIDELTKVNELHKKFGADCVEMEAFAFLSTAREYGKLDRCIVIKAISDGANNQAKNVHMSNLELAMKNSIVILNNLIQGGK